MTEYCVIPAIIPRSLRHLGDCIEKLGGAASEIQIDIVDSIFVPYKSWPYTEDDPAGAIGSLAGILPGGMTFELDLMIAMPSLEFEEYLATHPRQVVLHAESYDYGGDWMFDIEKTHNAGAQAIWSSNNDTPLSRLEELMPRVDGVQCMGIAEIGRQGNPFDERVLMRIKELREKYPVLPISVDGSVNAETIGCLKEAGANRFVAGSAIFDTEDPQAAYRRLADLAAS